LDLVLGPARWLARPIAALLALPGSTPRKRRDEVLGSVTLAGEDVADLATRHLTRMATWFVTLGVAFATSLVVSIPVSALGGPAKQPVLFAVDLVLFVIFFLGAIHLVKMLIAYYVLGDRWDYRSRWWRAAMLAPLPDLLVATAAALPVAASIAG